MKTPKIIFSIKVTSPELKENIIVTEIVGAFNTMFYLEQKCGLNVSEQQLYKMKKETLFVINNEDYKNHLMKRFIMSDLKSDYNQMLDPHIVINRIN